MLPASLLATMARRPGPLTTARAPKRRRGERRGAASRTGRRPQAPWMSPRCAGSTTAESATSTAAELGTPVLHEPAWKATITMVPNSAGRGPRSSSGSVGEIRSIHVEDVARARALIARTDHDGLAELFGALGDPTRLAIVQILLAQEMCT